MFIGEGHLEWSPARRWTFYQESSLVTRECNVSARYLGMNAGEVKEIALQILKEVVTPGNPVYEPLMSHMRNRRYEGVAVNEDILIE